MNSKQLFLTTALITSLSSAAIADISISGEAKVNSKYGLHTMEADLTITGKSGDTSVVAQLGLDNSNMVEQLYMTSKVAGIDVKAGIWKKKKSELNQSHNWGGDPQVQVSTSFGGVNFMYRDVNGNGRTKLEVSGSVAGIKASHSIHSWKTDTQLTGSIGDIDVALHNKNYDPGVNDNSITLKTSIQGIELTYVDITSDMGIWTDGFIGKYAVVTDANAFGISITIAGNKLTYKDIMVDGTNSQKLILTRKIASGAIFEAIYRRDSADPAGDWLDLELAFKF